MKINKELIKKYADPVPRYTSYPPANFFKEGFSGVKAIELIEHSNSWDPQNISIYIHIPFCNKLCFYCGCNSSPMAKQKEIKKYIDSLKTEIKLVLPLMNKNRKISQIHYGGGTPNSIPVEYLKELNQIFFDAFEFIDEPEIAIECHPGYLDFEYINELKNGRFNRFSLGIQDFNNHVLKHVNRLPSKLPVNELASIIRKDKKAAVNLDFIYGLPGQTIDSFKQTIEEAIRIKPDRLVTFSYAHVPWVNKNQLILEKKGLPEMEAKTEMFELAYNHLLNADYTMIGMDHYVLGSDELKLAQDNKQLHRNFQGYCTRRTTGQVYAFGVSAISQLQHAYFQNTKSIDLYNDELSKHRIPVVKGYKLAEKELLTREIITNLMCNKVLDINTFAKNQVNKNENYDQVIIYNEEKLSTFENDGIIVLKEGKLRITELGTLFVRNVAAALDPILLKHKKQFSKSV